MNKKVKIALASVLWLTTSSGAFFYGYTQAIKKAVPELETFTLSRDTPSSEAAPSLSEEELEIVQTIRDRGGVEALREILNNADNTPNRPRPEGEPEPMSSSEALEVFLSALNGDNLNRESVWRSMRSLEGEDIKKAFAALQELGQGDRMMRGMAGRLIQSLARQNPGDAIEMANSIEANSIRARAMSTVIDEWARQEPYAVLDWIGENPTLNEATLSRASFQVFRQIASDDVAAATDLLSGIEDPETRSRAASGVLAEVINQSENGNAAVIDFIMSQPEDMQESLVDNALRNNEFRSFEDGINLAQSLESTNPQLAREAYEEIAVRNSRDFPEETANWALTLDDKDTQNTVFREVIENWTRYDMDGAGQWLASAPSGPEFDGAYREYAQEAAKTDPANAITWAEAIHHDDNRDTTIRNVTRSWASQDPNAAISYVESTQYMSPEAREDLLKTLRE